MGIGQTHSAPGGGHDQAAADVEKARAWAWTVLEKAAWTEAGRRSPVVILVGGGTVARIDWLHATYTRLVLRALDADVVRLRAAAAGCRQRHLELTATEDPHPVHESYRIGAQLADAAADIVAATGMHPDAGPEAREAVMAEADLWRGTSSHAGWNWGARRAAFRRRRAFTRDAAARAAG